MKAPEDETTILPFYNLCQTSQKEDSMNLVGIVRKFGQRIVLYCIVQPEIQCL